MSWDVEYTDEFGAWWADLSEAEQESLAAVGAPARRARPQAGFPPQQRNQRFEAQPHARTENPARRAAVSHAVRLRSALIGGDKTGDGRWYEVNVPIANRLYDDHMQQLRREGLING